MHPLKGVGISALKYIHTVLLFLEVEIHLGSDRLLVAEVLGVEALGAVRAFTRRRERLEGDLSDRHAVVKLDRQTSRVKKLERQVERVARIEIAGRGMDDESQATEGTLALESADEAVGHAGLLGDEPERKLPRMEDERFVLFELDRLHEILGRRLGVDDEVMRRVEDEEMSVEVQVDTRRLDMLAVERLDYDAALFLFLDDVAVGEDHRYGSEKFKAKSVKYRTGT